MRIIDEVIRLAKTNPDNQYLEDKCFYTSGKCSNGTHGCIVGQALVNMGFTPTILKKYDMHDNVHASTGVQDLINKLSEEGFEIEDSNVERELLEHIQAEQDAKVPWGPALSTAREICIDNGLINETEYL